MMSQLKTLVLLILIIIEAEDLNVEVHLEVNHALIIIKASA